VGAGARLPVERDERVCSRRCGRAPAGDVVREHGCEWDTTSCKCDALLGGHVGVEVGTGARLPVERGDV